MIGSVIVLLVVLVLIPLCMGLIPVSLIDGRLRSLGVTYISGFLFALALFQIVAVPILIMDPWGFKLVVPIFTALTVLVSLIGILMNFLTAKKENRAPLRIRGEQKLTAEEVILWGMVFLLIGFQLFMAVTKTSFDGDDAYYVVHSLLTQETDTMYRTLPYTGLSTALDLRHSLAVFPMWIAYVAKMSGVHSTIVAHTILPLVLIPLTYWIYLEIGKKLLRKDMKKLPVFMIFITLMHIFGNVSIYTNATFLLTRNWQGKSILANLVIPTIFWLFLWIFDGDGNEKENRLGLWIMLFTINFVAAMSSTASVFLVAMLIGVTGLILGIKEKNIQIPLRLMITCIPLVIYGVMFLVI